MDKILIQQIIQTDFEATIKPEIWVTYYGDRMYVKEMNTPHIRRCINCLRGRGEKIIPPNYLGKPKRDWLKIFKQELISRQ